MIWVSLMIRWMESAPVILFAYNVYSLPGGMYVSIIALGASTYVCMYGSRPVFVVMSSSSCLRRHFQPVSKAEKMNGSVRQKKWSNTALLRRAYTFLCYSGSLTVRTILATRTTTTLILAIETAAANLLLQFWKEQTRARKKGETCLFYLSFVPNFLTQDLSMPRVEMKGGRAEGGKVLTRT